MEHPQTPLDTENSNRLAELIKKLSLVQIRFCVARVEEKTDKAAAAVIGITEDTVKGWHKYGEKELVDEAAKLMAYDGVITALEILRRNVGKAAAIKAAGLDSANERIQQDASTEILNRVVGPPTQKTENNTHVDGAIEVVHIYIPDNKRPRMA